MYTEGLEGTNRPFSVSCELRLFLLKTDVLDHINTIMPLGPKRAMSGRVNEIAPHKFALRISLDVRRRK